VKTFVLTLQFDEHTELAVQRLWTSLTPPSAGRTGRPAKPPERYRPHVTLAAYAAQSADALHGPLQGFCAARKPFPIRFHAVGIFPETKVVYLSPTMTAALESLHLGVLDLFTGNGWPPLKFAHHLAKDGWMPHCTLLRAATREKVGWAVETLARGWRDLEGEATTIGIHELGTTTDVFRCRLGAE